MSNHNTQILNSDENMIILLLDKLCKIRPIFNNESDFQFSLGWLIKEENDSCEIRFEKLINGIYLDLYYQHMNKRIAIELKYKSSFLIAEHNNELFELKEQSSIDTGRFDVLKDLERVEMLVLNKYVDSGYVIFLTNCQSYWQKPNYKDEYKTNDKEFRLYEDRIIHGKLLWKPGSKIETYGPERINGLEIKGYYKVKWHNYYEFKELNHGIFKYITFKVDFT